jgi:hypothetical protein
MGFMLTHPSCEESVRFAVMPIVQQSTSHGLQADELKDGLADFFLTPQPIANCFVPM